MTLWIDMLTKVLVLEILDTIMAAYTVLFDMELEVVTVIGFR